MAAKRPSTPQIRARKVKLIKYLGTTRKTDAQVANEFGVTTSQLRKFLRQNPKQARREFNRSPSLRKLYQEVGAPKPRYRAGQRIEQVRGVRLVQFQYKPRDLRVIRSTPGLAENERDRRLEIGNLLQRHYSLQARPEYEWAEYARIHHIPVSMNALKILKRNNRISDSEYDEIITTWRQIYNINEQAAA